MFRTSLLALGLCVLASSTTAQFDPGAGDWGKDDPDDLRVMTWNVEDGLCSSVDKITGLNSWEALVRIVASMQPDVLILQETADNSGNGTGSGVDSVGTMNTVLELFMHGGPDPFNGFAPVTSYVQLYAPGYDLPYIFVSSATDSFNRNAIMSRYPFADLNGDGNSQFSNTPPILPDLYAPGGTGGIRGFQHAEIDLPDEVYAGDLFIGNSHLKAGGSSSDQAQRREAAQNIAYFIDALLNGLGTGTPDPNSKIIDAPVVTSVLDDDTVVVTGGDWNEDESSNGQRGPADWITQAAQLGGTDGTDRDRSDMTFDSSVDSFNGNDGTLGNSKLDYLAWQDSIATLRHSFVFNSATLPNGTAPAELAGYPINPQLASGLAADHRPVVADLILPLAVDCPPAATDLGNGKAGTGGVVPLFEACGELSTGSTADLVLSQALPGASAYLILSFSQVDAPFAGGVLVPAPDVILGPVPVFPDGTIPLLDIAGGGGPADLYMQWVILDPGATFGKALSNGIAAHFLP